MEEPIRIHSNYILPQEQTHNSLTIVTGRAPQTNDIIPHPLLAPT